MFFKFFLLSPMNHPFIFPYRQLISKRKNTRHQVLFIKIFISNSPDPFQPTIHSAWIPKILFSIAHQSKVDFRFVPLVWYYYVDNSSSPNIFRQDYKNIQTLHHDSTASTTAVFTLFSPSILTHAYFPATPVQTNFFVLFIIQYSIVYLVFAHLFA